MVFGRGKKQKGSLKKTEVKKRQSLENKPIETSSYSVPVTAAKMATRLVAEPKFVKFCEQKKLGNPQEAFVKFYLAIEGNEKVWKLEGREEERFEDAGKHFSRTGFYANLFIKCSGNPLKLSQMFFKP